MTTVRSSQAMLAHRYHLMAGDLVIQGYDTAEDAERAREVFTPFRDGRKRVPVIVVDTWEREETA